MLPECHANAMPQQFAMDDESHTEYASSFPHAPRLKPAGTSSYGNPERRLWWTAAFAGMTKNG
jgi:hypothetical protein